VAVSTDYNYVPFIKNEDNSTNKNQVKDGSVLGKDDFLKLMVTQLQHQNPLEPMDNTEYISQMASFSSLEQMSNLNTSFERMAALWSDYLIPQMQWQQAAQVLGKTVTYQNPSTEEGAPKFLTGLVDSVLAKDGQIFFMINDNEISMDSVTQIWAQSDSSLELLEDIRDQVKDLLGTMEMTEDEADG
jgi:flagellar basal-body rod modification protein FlgD